MKATEPESNPDNPQKAGSMTRLVRLIRCPRCRGKHIELVETAETGLDWTQEEDGTITPGVQTSGEITRVNATCNKCGHYWRIRGWTQIQFA